MNQKLNALRKTIDRNARVFNALAQDLTWGYSTRKGEDKGVLSALMRLRTVWAKDDDTRRMSGIRVEGGGPR